MLIRAMDINDVERVVELENILFTSSWNASDFMYEILENQFSYNFVLEEDECIVGYVGVWIMYEQSQITTIGIDPLYQRRGLGRALLEAMIDFALQQDCQVMSLEVRISNQKALSLYQSLGFQTKAIRKNYYQDNHEDAYLMVKELEGQK
ncbi:MAG: ribosomal protein S18-alanine N-acetyltransferase [Longibaculum sp.]